MNQQLTAPGPHWLTCQSAPMCTRTEWAPLLHAGKQMSAPAPRKSEGEAGTAPVLPAVAPLDWQDRSGWINSQNSHMIIIGAPCWSLTLYGFQGVSRWCGSLLLWAPCRDVQSLQVFVHFETLYINCRSVWRVDDEWSLRLNRKVMEKSALKYLLGRLEKKSSLTSETFPWIKS